MPVGVAARGITLDQRAISRIESQTRYPHGLRNCSNCESSESHCGLALWGTGLICARARVGSRPPPGQIGKPIRHPQPHFPQIPGRFEGLGRRRTGTLKACLCVWPVWPHAPWMNGTPRKHKPKAAHGRTCPRRWRSGTFASGREIGFLILTVLIATPQVSRGTQFSSNEVWQTAVNFNHKLFFPAKTRVGRIDAPDNDTGVWRAKLEPRGFILLHPDDTDLPIIGFSAEASLNLSAVPENGLRAYLRSKRTAQRHDARGPEAWALLNGSPMLLSATNPTSVTTEPLTDTQWDQCRYYNTLCPTVGGALDGYDGRVPVGCVATAMAQLMRFYSWPAAGQGVLTYSDAAGSSQGTYRHDFSEPIAWNLLKDHVTALIVTKIRSAPRLWPD